MRLKGVLRRTAGCVFHTEPTMYFRPRKGSDTGQAVVDKEWAFGDRAVRLKEVFLQAARSLLPKELTAYLRPQKAVNIGPAVAAQYIGGGRGL